MSNGNFNVSKSILKKLPSNLTDKRLLDIGFGCGQLTHSLITNSGREFEIYRGIPYILGIDIDPRNIELAQKYMPYYRKVLLKDAVDIPYPLEFAENLDIVMCTQMVEHIEDKKKTIEMIKYVKNLAPIVIFTCPNGDTRADDSDHKSVWYQKDFIDLGFNTELISIYPSDVLFVLDILCILKKGRKLARNITAWKISS